MKAMIFAAGLGTRLHPLTETTPKALIPIGGEPMIKRVILRLKQAGFTEIVVNVHYLAEQIITYLAANDYFGLNIHVSDERQKLLDTGGGILHARSFLEGEESFLVHNVDILTDCDLRALYDHHVQSGADATLLVSRRDTSRQLLLNEASRLVGWRNHQTGELKPAGITFRSDYREFAFAGIHVISPTLLRRMGTPPWTDVFSIIPFYLAMCLETRIVGYPMMNRLWIDIGKPDTLAQAQALF